MYAVYEFFSNLVHPNICKPIEIKNSQMDKSS